MRRRHLLPPLGLLQLLTLLPLLASVTATCGAARGQHCAPIYQSFLSEISMKWADDTLKVHAEYTKEGGRDKPAYQAYVIAYLEKDRKLVPSKNKGEVFDPKVALVLHTQVIKRNKDGSYDLDYAIEDKQLVKRVIEHRKLGDDDRTKNKYWHVYKDKIRIAVFIPFLEDKKYATLEGLPEDRHECNYPGDRALLFQTLPNRIDFRTAHAEDIKGNVWVRVNGDKPEI